MFWLALVWWLLVVGRFELIAAFVFGLGPLVRPDFAVVALVACGAQIALGWPMRPRAVIAHLGVALALPLAYEVFLAGYYGTLVPLPALAKSAAGAEWHRGLVYVRDFTRTYFVGVPVAIGAAVLAIALWRGRLARRDWILLAAPLISGALLLAFVMRVGGDFMHARMCLPPLFLALLPAAVVPLRRATVAPIGVMACWALAAGIWSEHREPTQHAVPYIEDERVGYIAWTNDPDPDEAAYLRAEQSIVTAIADHRRTGQRRLLSEGDLDIPLASERPASAAIAVGRLGAGGLAVPLDAIVVDTLGLANPLGARITPTDHAMAGHEKSLPLSWVVADFGAPSTIAERVDGISPGDIAAARDAMTCGAIPDLLASVRAPMTWSRFWANLAGAWSRTWLVVPADPLDAEDAFCRNHPPRYVATASSSYEFEHWSLDYVVDGQTQSSPTAMGFSTTDPAPQWLAIDLRQWRWVSAVVMDPRTDAAAAGAGLPIDFEIQTWNGFGWVTRLTISGHHQEGAAPDVLALPSAAFTSQIRIYATRLATVGPHPMFQLAELEVR
jgi:arabinofuranosyltransferase